VQQLASDEHHEAKGRRGSARLRLVQSLIVLLMVLSVASAMGGYWWRYWAVPAPPQVDLTSIPSSSKQAIEEALQEVRKRPRSADAWGRYGMALLAFEFNEEAITCFARAEWLDPEEARWPYLHAMAIGLTDFEAALAHYRRATALASASWDTPRLRLADLLLTAGHKEEAEDNYRRLLEADPQHARAHLGLATLAFERGDLLQSRQHLRFCTVTHWTQKTAYQLQARIYARQGNEAAASHAADLVEKLPNDVAWPDGVMEAVDLIRGDMPAAIASRAAAMLRSQRLPDTIALLRNATQSHPDTNYLWLMLGQVLLTSGQYREGEEALQHAVKLSPNTAIGHFFLGSSRFGQRKYAAATDCFRKATDLQPDYDLAQYFLGESLGRIGDNAGAIRAYEAAIACKPDYAKAHRSLGRLLADAGKKEDALFHLREAVKSDPSDTEAKQWLEQLQKLPCRPAEDAANFACVRHHPSDILGSAVLVNSSLISRGSPC